MRRILKIIFIFSWIFSMVSLIYLIVKNLYFTVDIIEAVFIIGLAIMVTFFIILYYIIRR